MDFYIILLDVDSKVIADSVERCDYWLVLTFYLSVEVVFLGRPSQRI